MKMHGCLDKYYTAEPYHDGQYVCDEAGQELVRAASIRKDRNLTRLIVLMAVSFAVALLSGVLWFVPGLVLGAVSFVGSCIAGVVIVLIGRPLLRCSRCGQRMTTDWGPIRDEREGEYQVCRQCRTYVFNYRTSR